MKICTQCKESKELSEFTRAKGRKDGVRSNCKECCIKYRKTKSAELKLYRESRKELNVQYRKEYREKNREKLRESDRLYAINNKEKIQLYNKSRPKRSKEEYLLKRPIMYANNAKRRAVRYQATPPWLTKEHLKEIKQFYIQANELEKLDGIKRHVDHIIPLKGKNVCGLHVPWNLQILTAEENMKKGNRLEN